MVNDSDGRQLEITYSLVSGVCFQSEAVHLPASLAAKYILCRLTTILYSVFASRIMLNIRYVGLSYPGDLTIELHDMYHGDSEEEGSNSPIESRPTGFTHGGTLFRDGNDVCEERRPV